MSIEIRILVSDFCNSSVSLPVFSDDIQGMWAKYCLFLFSQNMKERI